MGQWEKKGGRRWLANSTMTAFLIFFDTSDLDKPFQMGWTLWTAERSREEIYICRKFKRERRGRTFYRLAHCIVEYRNSDMMSKDFVPNGDYQNWKATARFSLEDSRRRVARDRLEFKVINDVDIELDSDDAAWIRS